MLTKADLMRDTNDPCSLHRKASGSSDTETKSLQQIGKAWVGGHRKAYTVTASVSPVRISKLCIYSMPLWLGISSANQNICTGIVSGMVPLLQATYFMTMFALYYPKT
jgi:hypothetical protein